MPSSRPFSPLEWSYQSCNPLRTLWRWTDCALPKALWMLLVFVTKQSPAWGMPLVIAMVIDWLIGEIGLTSRGLGIAVGVQVGVQVVLERYRREMQEPLYQHA